MVANRFKLSLFVVISVLLLWLFYSYGRSIWVPVYQRVVGKETVQSVLSQYGNRAESRLKPYFKNAGVNYPPEEIKLLALKEEKVLELWARDVGEFKRIRKFKVKAASGKAGPKLREGDKQVPEGKYKIIGLNPNSSYHLSMKLNYPNTFDLKQAKNEGRVSPGNNIFIHGKAVSIGCLAMGDTVIEELFTLVYKVGVENSEVIIAPYDPRERPLNITMPNAPVWLPNLYNEISEEIDKYKE